MIRRSVIKVLASMFATPLIASEKIVSMQGSSDGCRFCLNKFRFPTYPLLARQTSIEGFVSATLRISDTDRVDSVDGFSGHEIFRQPIEESTKSFQWRLTVALPRFRRAESRRTWRDRCSCGP